MSTTLHTYITTKKQDAVIYKAKLLYHAAGDDFHREALAIDDIKKMLAGIGDDILLQRYVKAISQQVGIKQADLGKAVKGVQEAAKK